MGSYTECGGHPLQGVVKKKKKNPLSPEFFPQQCTFVYAQHMPCSQVLLSHSVRSPGTRLCGTSAWKAPSGKAINDIHNHQAIGGQSGYWTDSHAGPPLNLDWIWAGAHHTSPVCMFLRPSEQSINLNKPNTLRKLHPCFVRGAHRNLTKVSRLWPKLGPKPSKAYLWHFLLWWEALQVHRVRITSIDVCGA